MNLNIAIISNFQKSMMDRFKFMENSQVNNVFKIKDTEVNYYEYANQKFQFDELFELTVDLDENARDYTKQLAIYPDGRKPIIMNIEQIYEGVKKGEWKHPQMPEMKGFNGYIDENSIRKTKGIYKPKAMIMLCDELNELMNSDNYKAVDAIKQALGSIARLGRAAAVHLALACQRASGGTISSDLKNNIQMSVLLGGFDSGASTLMFEKDISNLAKPEIKGRGFIQSGNEIIETQTYYTQPENDWIFDENLKATYDNPVYTEQKKRKNETIDNSGFVPQHPLDEQPPEEVVDNLLDETDESTEDSSPKEIEDLFGDNDENLFNSEEDQKPSSIGFKFSSGKSVEVKTDIPKDESEIEIKAESMTESKAEQISQSGHLETPKPKLKLNKILVKPDDNREASQEKPKIKFKL